MASSQAHRQNGRWRSSPSCLSGTGHLGDTSFSGRSAELLAPEPLDRPASSRGRLAKSASPCSGPVDIDEFSLLCHSCGGPGGRQPQPYCRYAGQRWRVYRTGPVAWGILPGAGIAPPAPQDGRRSRYDVMLVGAPSPSVCWGRRVQSSAGAGGLHVSARRRRRRAVCRRSGCAFEPEGS